MDKNPRWIEWFWSTQISGRKQFDCEEMDWREIEDCVIGKPGGRII